MLDWEDHLRSHPSYIKAALAGSRVSDILIDTLQSVIFSLRYMLTSSTTLSSRLTTSMVRFNFIDPQRSLTDLLPSFSIYRSGGGTDAEKKAKKKAKKAQKEKEDAAKKGTHSEHNWRELS